MATQTSNSLVGWDALLTAAHAWQFWPSTQRTPATRDPRLLWLSPDERAQYERFRIEGTRGGYLAARVLCRTTLSRYTGVDPSQWRFGVGAHGKPMIVEPAQFKSLRFNLTHTNDLVICLISRAGEVGVDAEEISKAVDISLVARHFLSHRQQTRLANMSEPERTARFFELWTLKEAYVKATGKGLARSPERLTIERGDDGQPVAIRNCKVSVHRASANHVAAAAVLERDCAAPVSIEWFTVDETDA